MEPGKLFVGGISWDTRENRLREYFETFGEVVEAVIMKDRTTGRARGFGFVIYADPAVAERVVGQKHMLDGRTVEAKKAVPRDDQLVLNKNGKVGHGSTGPTRTKKIFVGGLASTVTESDFKRYFDQFGVITDVVVMYDHNTQRPRGFGFITYDSEEAVDRVLVRTFHELNGKMVEVKRAVPKELSPGPNRSQLSGSYGLSRVSSFLNGYTQGYNPGLVGGFGVGMDDRHGPIPVGRGGFPFFGPTSFGSPLSSESRMSPSNRETSNFFSNIGYEHGLRALCSGNMKWNNSFIENDGVDRGCASSFNSTSWSLWGNGSNNNATYSTNSTILNGFRSGDDGAAAFNRVEAIWGSSSVSGHTGEGGSSSSIRGLNYGHSDFKLGSGHEISGPVSSSFAGLNGHLDTKIQELYEGNGGLSWLSSSPELKASTSFELGLGNATSEVPRKNRALCW